MKSAINMRWYQHARVAYILILQASILISILLTRVIYTPIQSVLEVLGGHRPKKPLSDQGQECCRYEFCSARSITSTSADRIQISLWTVDSIQYRRVKLGQCRRMLTNISNYLYSFTLGLGTPVHLLLKFKQS